MEVLYPLTLPALLQHVVSTQAAAVPPTTLVICSSREAFLDQLSHALRSQQGLGQDALQQLVAPTLHNLSTARQIRILFCASVQALLAYLSACGRQIPTHDMAGERLVVVNPLALHAPTPSFSAQGLSRTFAAAVETARRVGASLWVVECVGMLKTTRYHVDDGDVDMDAEPVVDTNPTDDEEDPWEQEVSILNVSAKRFGSGASERAWAGRTVKVRRILGRWFHFRRVDGLHDLQKE